MDKLIFKNMESGEYEHPLDKTSLNALKKVPLLDTVVNMQMEWYMQSNVLIEHTGKCLHVTNKTMPRVYNLYLKALERLDMPKVYDLYIKMDYDYNAYTTGTENPIVVINTTCVQNSSDEEIIFLLGHELGHIKSGHLLYHSLALFIDNILKMAGSIGMALAQGLVIALMEWHRKSELTADRAGFLACQDINAVENVFMKFVGLPKNEEGYNFTIDTLMDQAQYMEDTSDSMTKKLLLALLSSQISHPWTAMRAKEIYKWKDSEEYIRLIEKYK